MTAKTKSVWGVVLGTLAILIGCLVLWHTIDVIFLAFAAVLFAIILSFFSQKVTQWTGLPYGLVVILLILSLILILTLIFWAAAPFISEQVNTLLEVLPKTYDSFKEKVNNVIDLKGLTKEKLASEFLLNHEKILGQATAIFSFTLGTITSFVIFGLVGIYLAFSPDRYFHGFLQAFPQKSQKTVANFLIAAGHSLRWWVLGKFVSMTIIGILTLIGLWILHVPLAFVLALLAALLTFIPYIGPILSSIPAILVALSLSPLLALYVLILYLIVHAVDSYLVSPYVDQRTVSLPPALTIMAQLLFTLLFGFIGLALATPLTVVFVLFIHELYKKNKE